MNTYIAIDTCDTDGRAHDPIVMPVDTEEEIRAAAQELQDRGLAFVEVWAGEEPDAVRTSRVVFAAGSPRLNPITGTEHDGLCEHCDEPLTEENVVEGDLGFYCSADCRDEGEDGPDLWREDFHADV